MTAAAILLQMTRLKQSVNRHKFTLTLHTDTNGLKADGNDVAYVDIEVTDENGDICPLCYDKIDFEFSGDGVFLADITAVNLILKISTRVLYIKITSMPSAVRTECLFVRQKMSES